MFPLRNVLSASFLFTVLITYALGQQKDQSWEDKRDFETFQRLLDQADPPSLHEALHNFSPKKFKHGAFPQDRTAVEFIHKEEPSLATSIVNLARRQDSQVVDLSKRQASPEISNGTVTTTPAGAPPESSTRVTPVPQTPESSTPAAGSSAEVSSTPVAANSQTLATSISTSSNAAPVSSSAIISTSSADASDASSSAPTITSSPGSTSRAVSLTAGQVVTTTNAVGLTIISTVGGGASTISPSAKPITSTNTHQGAGQTSVIVQTSTLANGDQSIVTAVTVVGAGDNNNAADTPTGTAGVGSTAASASPGLQTGEAVMTRGWGREMVFVIGGAVAFAGMM